MSRYGTHSRRRLASNEEERVLEEPAFEEPRTLAREPFRAFLPPGGTVEPRTHTQSRVVDEAEAAREDASAEAATAVALLSALQAETCDAGTLLHTLSAIEGEPLDSLSLVGGPDPALDKVAEVALICVQRGFASGAEGVVESGGASMREVGESGVRCMLTLCRTTAQAALVQRLAASLLAAPQAALSPPTLAASHRVVALLKGVAEERARLASVLQYDAGVQTPHDVPCAVRVTLTYAAFEPALSRATVSTAPRLHLKDGGRTATSTSPESKGLICLVDLAMPGEKRGSAAAGITPAKVSSASWTFSVSADAAVATCLGMAVQPTVDEDYATCTTAWLVRAYNGQRYARAVESVRDPTDALYKLRPNDRLRCDVDFTVDGGTCTVYRNDVLVGTPFKGLSAAAAASPGGLFPAVQWYSTQGGSPSVTLESAVVTLLPPTEEVARTLPDSVGACVRTPLCSLPEHHAMVEVGCTLGRNGGSGWATAPILAGKSAAVCDEAVMDTLGMYPRQEGGSEVRGGAREESKTMEVGTTSQGRVIFTTSGDAAATAEGAQVGTMAEQLDEELVVTAGMRASTAVWWLGGAYERLTGAVALADAASPSEGASVHFEITGDGRQLWSSGPVWRTRCVPLVFVVPLVGVRVLRLTCRAQGSNACLPALWLSPALDSASEWFCGGWRNDRAAGVCALCGALRRSIPGLPSPVALGLAPLAEGVAVSPAARAAAWTSTTHGLAHALLSYLYQGVREEKKVAQADALRAGLAWARPTEEGDGQEGEDFSAQAVRAAAWSRTAFAVDGSVHAGAVAAELAAAPPTALPPSVEYVLASLSALTTSRGTGGRRGAWPTESGGAGVVELSLPWPVYLGADEDADGNGGAGCAETLLMALQTGAQAIDARVRCTLLAAWPSRLHMLLSVPLVLGPLGFLRNVFAPALASAGLSSAAAQFWQLPGSLQLRRSRSAPLALDIGSRPAPPTAAERKESLALGRDGSPELASLLWYPAADGDDGLVGLHAALRAGVAAFLHGGLQLPLERVMGARSV